MKSDHSTTVEAFEFIERILLQIEHRVSGLGDTNWELFTQMGRDILAKQKTNKDTPVKSERTYTAHEAFALMQKGVWMTCGGYTLRNLHHDTASCGQNLSQGTIPCAATIRGGIPNTLASIERLSDKWHRVEHVDLHAELLAIAKDCVELATEGVGKSPSRYSDRQFRLDTYINLVSNRIDTFFCKRVDSDNRAINGSLSRWETAKYLWACIAIEQTGSAYPKTFRGMPVVD